MIRAFPCAAAAGLVLAAPLSAQQVSLRLGGLAAQYADSIDAQAGAAGLRLSLRGRRANGLLDASWAQFSGGGGAGQAWGRGLLVGPSGRRLALGARGEGVLNTIASGPWSTSGSVEVFGALVAGPFTFSAGASGGGVRTLDGARVAQGGGSLRAVVAAGPWTVAASAAALVVGGIQYADASLAADFGRDRLQLGALVATRRGDLATGAWIQGYASVVITPAIGLEAAAGSYPRDISGFDRGRYANVGLRLHVLSATRYGAWTADSPGASSAAPSLEVERLATGGVRLTLAIDGATTLGIAGAWNEWHPTPMERTDDLRWTVELELAPGAHRFALVVDGARWVVPEGVTKLPDDFGGDVGLLIVR